MILLNALAADHPKWPEVFASRCSAQLGLQHWDSAAADCTYALQLKPHLPTAVYGLAVAQDGQGKRPEAAKTYREYAQLNDPLRDLEDPGAAARPISSTLLGPRPRRLRVRRRARRNRPRRRRPLPPRPARRRAASSPAFRRPTRRCSMSFGTSCSASARERACSSTGSPGGRAAAKTITTPSSELVPAQA